MSRTGSFIGGHTIIRPSAELSRAKNRRMRKRLARRQREEAAMAERLEAEREAYERAQPRLIKRNDAD